jgi:hypothetical protein
MAMKMKKKTVRKLGLGKGFASDYGLSGLKKIFATDQAKKAGEQKTEKMAKQAKGAKVLERPHGQRIYTRR